MVAGTAHTGDHQEHQRWLDNDIPADQNSALLLTTENSTLPPPFLLVQSQRGGLVGHQTAAWTIGPFSKL